MENYVEGIKVEENGTLSFGNFTIKEKQKVDDFVYDNNTYSLRTYNKATKLEKNQELLLETTPGAVVHNFYKENKDSVTFDIIGTTDTIVTLQLESDTLYRVTSGKNNLGSMLSNSAGKVKFSVELGDGRTQSVSVVSRG